MARRNLLQESRMAGLEKLYASKHMDEENDCRIDELFCALRNLVGSKNLTILREYTDRLIVKYNANVEWFYKNGFMDGRSSAKI